MAAIWRQFSFHDWKFCHMFEISATKQKTPVIIIISDNYKGFSVLIISEPDGTQTHDLQNRNLALYSTKLRVHSIILTHVPNNRL